MLCGCVSVALLIRTIVAPPVVVVGRTADDLKAFLCKTNWWDHLFTSSKFQLSEIISWNSWKIRLCKFIILLRCEFSKVYEGCFWENVKILP